MSSQSIKDNTPSPDEVPVKITSRFETWFANQGWSIRDYQRDMVRAYQKREDTLLIAPTGGGKTLGGFLPSLIALSEKDKTAKASLKVLYISPLRALTNDIQRNLMRPIEDMNLPIICATFYLIIKYVKIKKITFIFPWRELLVLIFIGLEMVFIKFFFLLKNKANVEAEWSCIT
mgnify:CR=1 FL=1